MWKQAFLTTFLLGVMAMGMNNGALGQDDIRNRLEKHVFRNAAGETIPYRLLVPEGYNPERKYPLILFLHGAGERGNDNEAQLKHAEVLQLALDPKDPAFLVAPQCPKGHSWVEAPWDADYPHPTPEVPSKPMRLVMELLDWLETKYSIDPDRRYVTGLSMGGFGTFDILLRRPHYFAAAVPICGGADNARLPEVAHVPIWIFHGSADPVVPVERSRSAFQVLKEAGCDVRYTEYEGVGHNSWHKAYLEPELRPWLLSQRRKAPQ